MFFLKFVFWISAFIIFWAMVGYPISILLIDKIYPYKKESRDYNYFPTVTVMVVAHNEEKVIEDKLKNVLKLNYPKDKLEILVASDNSTDCTNALVRSFIEEHPNENIRLYKVKERMGKTNAQNEAQKTVSSEILVMTDANSMLSPNSVKELVASFSSEEIVYVTGRLIYKNEKSTSVSESESSYWNLDTKIRDVESRIQTITAGNGALYACRNNEYVEFDPIKSHDSSMPIYYGLQQKRAIMNKDALVYEKAGETQDDEFGRKVRMNRVLLNHIIPDISILNVLKYRWFSYFYFGHRTCRYLLWLAHTLLFMMNILLVSNSYVYSFIFLLQTFIYTLAIIREFFDYDNRLLNMVHYYVMTLVAQWFGVVNILTGKSKPFWEKAESTR